MLRLMETPSFTLLSLGRGLGAVPDVDSAAEVPVNDPRDENELDLDSWEDVVANVLPAEDVEVDL